MYKQGKPTKYGVTFSKIKKIKFQKDMPNIYIYFSFQTENDAYHNDDSFWGWGN